MDIPFISGMAAFVSAMLIFCGSAFLLLMLVVGARLAYFITASITLGFLLIMGVVWSINPLGPVGQLPEWDAIAAAEDGQGIEFGPISDYPDGGWVAPDEDDPVQVTQRSELEADATSYVQEQAAEGNVEGLPESIEAPLIKEDSSRFFEQGDERYGATTVEAEDDDGNTVEAIFVAKYDPGNPLGKARAITLGTLVLLVLHLIGLSASEKRARRREEVQPA